MVVQGDEVSRQKELDYVVTHKGGRTMNDTRMDRGNEGVEFK